MREIELAQARANEMGVTLHVYRLNAATAFTSPIPPDRMGSDLFSNLHPGGNMRILAIDPSTTCLGWACGNEAGHVKFSGARPQRFNRLARTLALLIERLNPDAVIYYRPFARGDDATRCGWGAAALIEAAAGDRTAVMDIAEVTVRKAHDFPKKADRATLKQFAIDKCRSKGYNPANDDEADAILLHLYAAQEIRTR